MSLLPQAGFLRVGRALRMVRFLIELRLTTIVDKRHHTRIMPGWKPCRKLLATLHGHRVRWPSRPDRPRWPTGWDPGRGAPGPGRDSRTSRIQAAIARDPNPIPAGQMRDRTVRPAALTTTMVCTRNFLLDSHNPPASQRNVQDVKDISKCLPEMNAMTAFVRTLRT